MNTKPPEGTINNSAHNPVVTLVTGHPTTRTTTGRIIRSLKARADAKRTPYEKFSDVITASFGSFAFLILNVVWFIVWMVWNMGVIPGVAPFDAFPFGLLTMIVSLEAIMLSIFVLISQNRASRVNDLREETDLQIDVIAEQEITKVMALVTLLAEKQGIDLSQDKTLHEMLKPLDTKIIEEKLEKQV